MGGAIVPFIGGHMPLILGADDHMRVQRPTERRDDMLNNIGLPGLLLIAIVVLVLFGRGKISSLMGEVGKGITAFKKGVDDGTKELDAESSDEVTREVTPEDEDTKA
jgi:sec-independent protein translocase protein TatA